MPEQEALTFDPRREGLYKAVLHNNSINHAQWMRAHAEAGFVGTCRQCEGGRLKPLQPLQIGTHTLYEAWCVQCRASVCAPDGKVLPGTSRLSEMPAGWWEARRGWLAKNGGEGQ